MHILMQKSAPRTLYGFFGQYSLRKPTKLYRMKLQTEGTFNRFFIIFHRYFLLKDGNMCDFEGVCKCIGNTIAWGHMFSDVFAENSSNVISPNSKKKL